MNSSKSPLIVVNLKTYLQGTGEKAVTIAKACKNVSEKYNVDIGVSPQFCDIYQVASQVDVPVYSQHIDGIDGGSHTGQILAQCVKDAGAIGTLVNHSERRLTLADIDSSVKAAGKAGLSTIVCTNNVNTSASAASLGPDYIAIEPPELIGTGVPVSSADPQVVKGSVDAVKNVNEDVKVLCGAGISKGEDLQAALELGSAGVLLASGVVKAEDPEKALEHLVSQI
ncbi:triosephosphate isomerase [Methanohalobium evestigatum Z-7303]|uniref:Triosephosphate isomerase n=1 Tax=Methanohalobium evestigatum (strain ATCC BAA-1072 / DSM 3721 / NBRC 107634 / OCM 161 / Z-7303) TaxID=644295 RepID=D7EB19_METEZ|nr:triose-phosphate isomerase [Methanohalobium evestigatum]ADI74536.1 triosephosphate isomerase [Methanohalobium evestigatum Z-7303]